MIRGVVALLGPLPGLYGMILLSKARERSKADARSLWIITLISPQASCMSEIGLVFARCLLGEGNSGRLLDCVWRYSSEKHEVDELEPAIYPVFWCSAYGCKVEVPVPGLPWLSADELVEFFLDFLEVDVCLAWFS